MSENSDPADGVQTPSGGRTLTVSWAPAAIRSAVVRAMAVLQGSENDVFMFPSGHLTALDLACLIDAGRAALGEDAPSDEPIAGPREPRRWPVGSPEPEETGLRVQSTTNDVIFRRWAWGRWLAEVGSGGDGRDYDWHTMNGRAAADGMELVEVIEDER